MTGSGTTYSANAGFNSGTAVFSCWYWQIRDNESVWLPLVKQRYMTYREKKTEQSHDTSASSSSRWGSSKGLLTFPRESLLPHLLNGQEPSPGSHGWGGWGWYRDTVVVLCFTETTLGCEASASSQTMFRCWALLQPGARQAWLSSCFCSTILINSSWEFWLASHGNYQSCHSKLGRFPQVASKEQIRSVDVSI